VAALLLNADIAGNEAMQQDSDWLVIAASHAFLSYAV